MRTISVRALGPVDVQVDGKPAPPELLWKRPLVLLLYLARSPRHTRTREHLVELLWPDQPAKAAHHSLNEALRIVRRYGGAAVVGTPSDQVRLDVTTLDLDLDRFEALMKASDWAGASALVGGTFLEGFGVAGTSGVEDWLTTERETWCRKSVQALARNVDALLEAGRLGEATDQAQRAANLDPMSDTAARGLMRSLALGGMRTEALQAYEAFAGRLASALDSKPDRETEALAARVRLARVWRRAPAPAAPEIPWRRAPLVGRSGELARLLRAWKTCRTTGRASVALVLGDAGMGKSRLADELLERARLDGAAASTARAVEADLLEPWSGLLALAGGGLLDIPGVAAAAPPALGALARRLPAWAERFPGAPLEAEPTVGRALRDVLRAVCTEQPCVLLVDDAQWLDRESLLAVAATARDLSRQPCFILLTAATHPARAEIDELRSRMRRDVPGTAISLAALGRDDLLALARWALPRYDEAALERVTRRVATDSAGLPLLAVELLSAVAMGLELDGTTSAWPEPLRTLDQTLPGDFPDAVVGAIRVNYRRLSPDARSVLAAASALGDRVLVPTLRRATGLAPQALGAALDELEWHRWLTAESRGYAFVARAVREIVARDMVPAGQRERFLAAARSPGASP